MVYKPTKPKRLPPMLFAYPPNKNESLFPMSKPIIGIMVSNNPKTNVTLSFLAALIPPKPIAIDEAKLPSHRESNKNKRKKRCHVIMIADIRYGLFNDQYLCRLQRQLYHLDWKSALG